MYLSVRNYSNTIYLEECGSILTLTTLMEFRSCLQLSNSTFVFVVFNGTVLL